MLSEIEILKGEAVRHLKESDSPYARSLLNLLPKHIFV